MDTPYDHAAERRIAWRLAALILLVLLVAKPLATIPYLGPVALTIAAGMQLFLPLWRADRLNRGFDFVGLHLEKWKQDLRFGLLLCLILFPPYAAAHHMFMVHGHGWLLDLGLPSVARLVPEMRFAPVAPSSLTALGAGVWWFGELTLTHTFGVAVPEEAFYRGYLQPQLESRWRPTRRYFGVAVGRAAVIVAALFALGHYLGEWNPLRLGPFFPALIFAWQRNATGSIVGAVGFHAACNVFGELLFKLYRPV